MNDVNANWIKARCAEAGVPFPGDYFDASRGGWSQLEDWEPVRPELAKKLAVALKERYPVRDVIPFGRRVDSDDLACVVLSDPERKVGSVAVVHNYASPGWEIEAEFGDVEAWAKYAASEEA